MKKYAISIIFVALISTLSLPSMQAYGGTFSDECIHDPPFDDHCVHAIWLDFQGDFGFNEVQPAFSWGSDSSEFDLTTEVDEPVGGCNDGSCAFTMPNFVDDLTTKKIIIEVYYNEQSPQDAPHSPAVSCHDSTGMSDVEIVNTIVEPGYTEWEIDCKPNPDWEVISFIRTSDNIQEVVIWTASFGEPVVGGEFLSIDSTALILAGAQTNAVWMLSALAVIGSVAFGALYLTSKKD